MRIMCHAWVPCVAILAVPLTAQPYTSAHTGTPTSTTISADLLRHPLPGKARQMLLKALHAIEIGDHPDAIHRLEETLAKYPDSAAWTQSLLGTEYLKSEQFE